MFTDSCVDEPLGDNPEEDNSTERMISLNIEPKCLLQFGLFGNVEEIFGAQQCNNVIDYFSDDYKEALKSYRMSFEVEWFQIDAKLFRILSQTLIDAERKLLHIPDLMPSLKSTENDDDKSPPPPPSALLFATLDTFSI